MMSDLSIKFLQQKIQELQTALFFSESESLSTITTHVISTNVVDDAGHVWFLVPNKSQLMREQDEPFAAKMDFFRKGKDFYIKIRGIASVVTREEEMIGFVAAEIRDKITKKQASVIRVKIQHADYFESITKPAQNWIQQSGSQIFNWLLNPQYDHKNPQLVAIPITLDH